MSWYMCSCATIMNGKTQRLTINSNISDATVKIDGQIVGRTPFLGDMPRENKNRVISVEYTDFYAQPQYMNVKTNSTFLLGNILCGGVYLSTFSTTTDFISGAVYEYEPSTFYFHFTDEYGSNTDEILIRKYAMLNHSLIALDAQEENGDYICALADLMNSRLEREKAITEIQVALETSQGDQLAFGDEVIKTFRKHSHDLSRIKKEIQ